MKIKIRKGVNLLSTYLNRFDNELIINFKNKYTYNDFKQEKNHLKINTIEGIIDFVFTGEIPIIKLDYYEKDQLVLKVIKNKLYHGSEIIIDDLSIASGTYFTSDLEIAKKYGNHIYSIDLTIYENARNNFILDNLKEHYISVGHIPIRFFEYELIKDIN
jgi:hypothetical protein